MLKKAAAVAGIALATLTACSQAAAVPVPCLVAVLNVESAGSGTLPDGRQKILLEGHVLWRRLQARGISPLALARAHASVCFPSWTTKWYRGGAGEYQRVQLVLDWAQKHAPAQFESYKKACYEACSWGLFQVLGENYAACGFADVYQFKHALEQGPGTQLAAALTFMRSKGLLGPLARREWAKFSRGWNGPGQVPVYALRLRLAYNAAVKAGF